MWGLKLRLVAGIRGFYKYEDRCQKTVSFGFDAFRGVEDDKVSSQVPGHRGVFGPSQVVPDPLNELFNPRSTGIVLRLSPRIVSRLCRSLLVRSREPLVGRDCPGLLLLLVGRVVLLLVGCQCCRVLAIRCHPVDLVG